MSRDTPKASAEAWVKMVNQIQSAALSTRLGILMIYGIDAVHGHNNVYKATIFPHNVGLGVTRYPVLIKKIGEATALEVRATTGKLLYGDYGFTGKLARTWFKTVDQLPVKRIH